MASVKVEPGLPAGVEPVALQRLSLDEFRKMNEVGLLPAGKVQLLGGLLVRKMPGNPRHASVVRRLVKSFDAILPAGWIALKEDTIELPGNPDGDGAPIPDVTIVAGTLDDYTGRHPGPDDIALVVEVASSTRTVALDRAGLSRYAWAGIRVAWIVNLANDTVEIYTGPTAGVPDARYGHGIVKGVGDHVELMLAGTTVAIPVADVLRVGAP
jgi:Uma2 family endonuclease